MTPAARRYAESLFITAKALDCIQAVADELEAVHSLLQLCGKYFYDPEIGIKEKAGLLRDAFSGQIHPLTFAFTDMLLRRRGLKYLPDAAGQYRHMCDRALGRVTVRLSTPFEPGPKILALLRTRLAEAGLFPAENAGQAAFDVVLDSELIGGFVAYYNGKQIDASMKTALVRLSRPERYGA